ncbi:hypothetical protein XaC1_429 [Xanthomonas phage XaC1]|nr:hypothetical protein XaC1_429 [Xanthomonas phage XaC1]
MALSLDKEVEKVKLTLDKVTTGDVPPVQVELLADVSGSMGSAYTQRGWMYPILQRTIALASVIDPDKVVQLTIFDTSATSLGDFGVDKFESIYKAFDGKVGGGTDYESAFNQVLSNRNSPVQKAKGFFGSLFGKKDNSAAKSTSKEPSLIVFFTDGEDGGSTSSFLKAVDKVLDGNTYLLCIGAGGSEYSYRTLKQLADQRSDVGYVYFDKPHNLTDDQFYNTVLSGEFGEWLKQFSA